MARSRSTGRGWHLRRIAAVLVAVGLVGPMVASDAAHASAYGFNKPVAIAKNGGNLWIANYSANSLTETNSSGAFIRNVSGAQYNFHGPNVIVSYLGYLFVVSLGGSVTEVNASTGALIRVVQGPAYRFNLPTAAVVQGGHLWVVNTGGATVVEIDATTGALIRVLSNGIGPYGFKTPDAIAVAGTNLWVTNKAGGSTTNLNAGSATEFGAATGAFVRRVAAAADGLQQPSGIAFDGTHLWISDTLTDSVTELTSVGALVRIVLNSSLNSNYGLDSPSVVVASGQFVYVISPTGASPMVTQINASTAAGDWFECNTNTPNPEFKNPTGLTVQGDHVWVVSPGDNTLTELSLAAGGNRIALFT